MSERNHMGYEWNDTFHDSSSTLRHRRILQEGDYDFEVVDFKKGRVKSGSSAGANQALYTLLIDGEYIRYYLPLIDSVRWKVTEFFKGIGISIEGRRIPWEDAVGRRGRCRVRPRQYEDSSVFNDVVKVWPMYGSSAIDAQAESRTARQFSSPSVVSAPLPIQQPLRLSGQRGEYDFDDSIPF